MTDLIIPAQVAVEQEDWSTLVSILHQVLLESPMPPGDWLRLALQVLQAGDFQAQWEVAKLLPSFGKATIAPLIAVLQDDTAELEARWYAARILGEMNDVTAIQALVTQMQSPADDLSEVVATALANLGPTGVEALTELLQDSTIRPLALKALTQIHQPVIIAPLLSVIKDVDPTSRVIALEALSAFDDPRLPDVFIQAVKDPVAPVRRAAIAGFGARADWVVERNLTPLLVDCLWDLNLGVCRQAALTLGKVGGEAALPGLKRALMAQSTPTDLHADILLALSWIGSPPALQCLLDCLPPHTAHLSPEALPDAISLLGRWQDVTQHARIVQSFVTALEGLPQPSMRQAIAAALGELKHPDGLDPLIQLLGDSDAGVRLHAIAALQQVDAPLAYTRLTQLQSGQELSESLRDGVIVALREWNAQLPRSGDRDRDTIPLLD
jgi:HEAT repeat protein